MANRTRTVPAVLYQFLEPLTFDEQRDRPGPVRHAGPGASGRPGRRGRARGRRGGRPGPPARDTARRMKQRVGQGDRVGSSTRGRRIPRRPPLKTRRTVSDNHANGNYGSFMLVPLGSLVEAPVNSELYRPVHADDPEVVRLAAVLYSVVGTCRRLGLDPWAYLRDVLARFPSCPAARLDALPPGQCAHERAVAADRRRWTPGQPAGLELVLPPDASVGRVASSTVSTHRAASASLHRRSVASFWSRR